MKKRKISLLLCAALALALCACAPAGEGPSPSPSPADPTPAASAPALATPAPEPTPTLEPSAEPTPMPEPSGPPETAEGYDLPDRKYQPWQKTYMDFLVLIQTHKTTWEPGAWGELVGSESYSLYDVDKDGVPELFVKFGSCEADYFARCYTVYTDMLGKDVAVMAAQFPFGHSALYTCPDKNAVLQSQGHMGYHEIYEYGPLENGEMPFAEELFREEDVREYTEVDEIVPGAQYIESYYTCQGEIHHFFTEETPYSAGKALLLPVCDWGVGPAATGNDSEQARRAILAALKGETGLCGVSGDHFFGDVGPTTWAEYVRTVTAVPNAQVTAKIAAHFWQDMNGDGQEECVLQLESEKRRGEETWWGEDKVVLSEQDGVVYAYGFGYLDQEAFYDDGTIREYGEAYRLSFWKEQCYKYIGKPAGGSPVKWADGSPLD